MWGVPSVGGKRCGMNLGMESLIMMSGITMVIIIIPKTTTAVTLELLCRPPQVAPHPQPLSLLSLASLTFLLSVDAAQPQTVGETMTFLRRGSVTSSPISHIVIFFFFH
jgi:hypothetical protein